MEEHTEQEEQKDEVQDEVPLETKQPTKEEKKAKQLSHVIAEILDTEKAYVNHLNTLNTCYVTPLRKDPRFSELSCSSSKADVSMIFSTIDLIYDGNVELLKKLQETFDSGELMLGATFVSMMDRICQYTGVFCNHHEAAMNQIEEYLHTSSSFRTFHDTIMLQPEVNNLKLLDFLIKPFQRMLKYSLLLKELLKNTPEEHPDYLQIEMAVTRFSEEILEINKQKDLADKMKKMVEISQTVDSFPKGFKLLTSSRYAIFEGTLKKISGNHDQERHFILFNDCLMYCKKRSANKYQCRGIIYLNKLRTEDAGDECSFRIHRSDKDLTYTLYGNSNNEKKAWLREIKMVQSKGLGPSALSIGDAKKESIRIYIDQETFKTIAVTPNTTAAEAINDCLRKQKSSKEGTYHLILEAKDKEPKIIGDEEKPLLIQQQLNKRKDDSHFKIISSETLISLKVKSTPTTGLRTAYSTTSLDTRPKSPSPSQRSQSISLRQSGSEIVVLPAVVPALVPPQVPPRPIPPSKPIPPIPPPRPHRESFPIESATPGTGTQSPH